MTSPAQQPELPDVPFEDEAASAPRVRVDDHDSWRDHLIHKTLKNGDQVVAPNVSNVVLILRHHPEWRDVLAWDAFGEKIVTRKAPPWSAFVAAETTALGPLLETDNARIIDWLARNERLTVGARVVEQAVPVVAEARAFHPVREYLNGLEWDGVPRLATWLSRYCGAEQSPYTEAIGTRWMISAVARPMEPGAQVDSMLVLQGVQGIGKSSLFRYLVPTPALYSETGVTIGDKDSYQALHGVWIYVLDELDSLKRGDVTKTKNFMTAAKDHFRPSYGRIARDFYRQCVFAGTTNEEDFLVDRTGNRRFWPIRVVRPTDIPAIARDRDMLWAESFQRYIEGARWHVDTPELRALCEAEQTERVQGDAWEGIVSHWLANPRRRLGGDTLRATGEPFPLPGGAVLVEEILAHGLGKDPSAITKGDEMRVAQILRDLGYRRGRQVTEHGSRVRRYEVVQVEQAGSAGVTNENDDANPPVAPPAPPNSHTYRENQDTKQNTQTTDPGDAGGAVQFDDREEGPEEGVASPPSASPGTARPMTRRQCQCGCTFIASDDVCPRCDTPAAIGAP